MDFLSFCYCPSVIISIINTIKVTIQHSIRKTVANA
jgi:hypothetical protein